MPRVYFSQTHDEAEIRIIEKLKQLGEVVTIQELSRSLDITPTTISKFLDKIQMYQDLPKIVVIKNYVKTI